MQMFPRWVLTHFTGVSEPVCTDTVLYLVCLRRHEPNYRSSVDQMCFHRHREPRVEVQQLRDAVVQRSKGKKIKATWYFNASVFCLLVQSLRHSTESWCDGQMGIMSVLITGVLTGLMWQDFFFFLPKVTSQSNANCINSISVSPNEEFFSHIMCWSAPPRRFQIPRIGLSRRKSQSRSRNPVKTLSVLRELK